MGRSDWGRLQLSGPIFSELINRQIESSNRATILSFISMGSTLYEASMGLLLGGIAERTLSGTFYLTGVWLIVVSIAAGLYFWRIGRLAK